MVGDQHFAFSAQVMTEQVAQPSSGMRPIRIHDLPGTGTTFAVIDTAVSEQTALGESPDGFLRLLKACGSEDPAVYLPAGAVSQGPSGASSLVVARAFSVKGANSYQDAIRAIEWVMSNKDRYRIRVLDLAFSLPGSATRADDLLDQAVMAAWKADIVVVSSADTAAL